MTEREATLDELLSEPIIRKVMASDGVRAADVRRLVQLASIRTFRKRSRQSISVAKATVTFEPPHAAGPTLETSIHSAAPSSPLKFR